MKIGNIVQPNAKGQIVIPKKIRKSLGITTHSLLHLIQSGKSIILHPISDVVSVAEDKSAYLEILKKTAGSWRGDSWPVTRKKRKQIELNASQNRKNTW